MGERKAVDNVPCRFATCTHDVSLGRECRNQIAQGLVHGQTSELFCNFRPTYLELKKKSLNLNKRRRDLLRHDERLSPSYRICTS